MNVFFCYCLSTLPVHLTAFKHPLTPASWCVYEPWLPVFKSRENRASNLQIFRTNIKNFKVTDPLQTSLKIFKKNALIGIILIITHIHTQISGIEVIFTPSPLIKSQNYEYTICLSRNLKTSFDATKTQLYVLRCVCRSLRVSCDSAATSVCTAKVKHPNEVTIRKTHF